MQPEEISVGLRLLEESTCSLTSNEEENCVEAALASFLKVPQDSRFHWIALCNAALACRRLSHLEEAEKYARQSIEEYDGGEQNRPQFFIQAKRILGELLYERSSYQDALLALSSADSFAKDLERRLLPSEDFGTHSSNDPELRDFLQELDIERAHVLSQLDWVQFLVQDIPGSLHSYRTADSLYKGISKNFAAGWAEMLTNYAHVLSEIGKRESAEYALLSALSICDKDENHTQRHRVINRLLTSGFDISTLGIEHSKYELMFSAAAAAENEKNWKSAYIRYLQIAAEAHKESNYGVGTKSVQKALELESQLGSVSLETANLRRLLAQLMSAASSTSPAEVRKVLIEGGHLWFDLVNRTNNLLDIEVICRDMHDHFRVMAGHLLGMNNYEEALLSFEMERALIHNLVLRKSGVSELPANPFSPDMQFIDCSSLRLLQERLDETEVIVSMAILPPSCVLFFLSTEGVQCHELPFPDDIDRFHEECEKIPTALRYGKGFSAFPKSLIDIGIKIKEITGERSVRTILPYAVLHSTPWRALLRHVGVPWKRLAASIGFSLFSSIVSKQQGEDFDPTESFCSLGTGMSKSVDFRQEALEFAKWLGNEDRYIPQCGPQDVTDGLKAYQVILVLPGGSRDTN